MSNHKPNPIHILQHSDKMHEFHNKFRNNQSYTLFNGIDVPDEFMLEFVDFTGDAETGDDCIIIGEDQFNIVETDNGKFYIEASILDPSKEAYDEYLERVNLAIEELKAGVPMELIVPQVSEPNYIGKYVDSIEEAVRLACMYLSLPIEQLPKEYNPPIPSRPR